MLEKQGRERKFVFRQEDGFIDTGSQWMFGMLLELGDRVFDQVEHLPKPILDAIPQDSYLGAARIIYHLVETDLRIFKLIVDTFPDAAYFPEPPHLDEVSKRTSIDLATMETEAIDSLAILQAHLAFRKSHIVSQCTSPGFLDEPINHMSFANKRDVLGHLIWHWSYHSGHIGAVTLELGYEYHWTSCRIAGRCRDS